MSDAKATTAFAVIDKFDARKLIYVSQSKAALMEELSFAKVRKRG
jgi:hypothetical protein